MSTLSDNKKLVETLCKTVFQNHDFSCLDEIMRDDYIQNNENILTGKAGFIEFHERFFKAMPDFTYTVKRIIAEDDIVVLHATVMATHQGELFGDPPTGNKLNYDTVDIFRIENGKIAEHWDVADTLKLFTQVGKVKQT